MNSITGGELWEFMKTNRENLNNTLVRDDVITCDKTEYSSHTLVEFVDGKHNNDWILFMRSRTGK